MNRYRSSKSKWQLHRQPAHVLHRGHSSSLHLQASSSEGLGRRTLESTEDDDEDEEDAAGDDAAVGDTGGKGRCDESAASGVK